MTIVPALPPAELPINVQLSTVVETSKNIEPPLYLALLLTNIEFLIVEDEDAE